PAAARTDATTPQPRHRDNDRCADLARWRPQNRSSHNGGGKRARAHRRHVAKARAAALGCPKASLLRRSTTWRPRLLRCREPTFIMATTRKADDETCGESGF